MLKPEPDSRGLVPGIHVFVSHGAKEDVDGRDKPGHDEKQNRFDARDQPPLFSPLSAWS
jgi:hypothetical protein